ncbi:MAG TPA: TolC family protein [Candidatus Methylacidiphilales bacterium]|nr:TolC family protein [Candidatus Methylacidiphilales bacterium]
MTVRPIPRAVPAEAAVPFSPAVRLPDKGKPETSPSPSQSYGPPQGSDAQFQAKLREIEQRTGRLQREWTLAGLVDEALRRHPATQSAWHLARAATQDVKAAKSAYYPTVTLNVDHTGSYATQDSFPSGSSEASIASLTPNLQVSWVLLDFGRDANVESARFLQLARNYDFNTAIQNVVSNVLVNYYVVEGNRANVQNAEAALALAEGTLDSTNAKFQAGIGNATDVAQARQNVAQSIFDLEQARGSYDVAEVRLTQAVGFPGSIRLRIRPPNMQPSLDVLDRSVDSLIDLALKRRPDVAAKYATWRAQIEQSKSLEGDILPKITLQTTAGRQYYTGYGGSSTGGEGFGNSFGGRNGSMDNASYTLSFSVDVFDGGLKRARAESAKQQAESLRAQVADTELGAMADVATSYASFKSSVKKYRAAQGLETASAASLDATRESYKAGLKNIIDVLTAERNLAAARSSVSSSRTELFTEAIRLATATGTFLPIGSGTARETLMKVGVKPEKPVAKP